MKHPVPIELPLGKEAQPGQVKCGTKGFLSWCERARNGEVHIASVDTRHPGEYIIQLHWDTQTKDTH